MKIALTIEYFDPAKGGGETYARNFGRALMRAGHEVHVFANDWDPAETGFIYHRVPRMKMLRRYAFARRAARMAREHEFDIVHGFGKSVYMDVFRPGGGVHRAWQEQEIKAVGGSPVKRALTRLRQLTSLDQRLVLRLEREQFRADGPLIIAVSKMVRDEAQRFYPVSDDGIRVIYNGVDLERFHPRNRERDRAVLRRELGLGDEPMLLFVGHNFKRKGLRPAIQAVARLRDVRPRPRLVVLGGDHPSRYAALADRLKCADMIQYLGASRHAERYYSAADMLVFPSYYDPCANVVLEALAAGLPVVTSVYNGSGELLTPGREGYAVDPDDTDALAGAIRSLLHPDAREAAGKAARALAETRPISRNFAEIMSVYELALARRKGRAAPAG